MDPTRRNVLATGAAVTAMAAAPQVFAQAGGPAGTTYSFFEKGKVRIRYVDTGGPGYPLMLISGGGMNSAISGLTNPFNCIDEFKGEFRCVGADLRNAIPGQSPGPLEVDRPWDSHADDQLG